MTMARKIAVSAVACIVVALVVYIPERERMQEAAAIVEADTIPWKPDDLALLGTTGLPQLVEFFHPT